jgi:hypothetical protein
MARTKEQKALIKKLGLTPKQAKFCELYATDEQYFANGTRCYAKAYKVDLSSKGGQKVAATNAYRLLTNAEILEYVDFILELDGLNDAAVDKELNFLIKQKGDLGVKQRAIGEYNKLRGRIIDKKALTDTEGNDVVGAFLDEIKNKDEGDLKPNYNPKGS